MSEKVETPKGETNQEDLGTEAKAEEKQVKDDTSEKEVEGKQPETVSKEDLAKIQKELDQIKQERNLLRNEKKKLESKVLESTEDYKSAYEELKTKLDGQEAKQEAEKARKEAEAFRDRVISEYPEAVQKAAKKLISKNPNNLIWEDAEDWNDARSQLTPQLDALKEALGVEDEQEEKPKVLSNNPGRSKGEKAFEDMTLEEMRKVLDRADSR